MLQFFYCDLCDECSTLDPTAHQHLTLQTHQTPFFENTKLRAYQVLWPQARVRLNFTAGSSIETQRAVLDIHVKVHIQQTGRSLHITAGVGRSLWSRSVPCTKNARRW